MQRGINGTTNFCYFEHNNTDMNIQVVNGYSDAARKKPTKIFTYQTPAGTWYVKEGGGTVNLTTEALTEGILTCNIAPVDWFTWYNPIDTIEEFKTALRFAL